MRMLLSAAAAFMIMTLPSAATGTFTSTGYVESINPQANIVRIRNGDAYQLPSGTDLTAFAPGDRVHVYWVTQSPQTISAGENEQYWLLDASGVQRAQ